MILQPELEKLDNKIQELKQAAQAVSEMADRFPAIKRNAARVLTSIKMMEINVCDVVRLTRSKQMNTAVSTKR